MASRLPLTRTLFWLTTAHLSFVVGPVTAETRNGAPVAIPGYEVGPLIAKESFSGDLGEWLKEGEIVALIKEGKLHVESRHPHKKNPKGNLWWRKRFQSPYLIEFDYRSLSRNGLTMVFWNASGIDGRDLFSWQRSGNYIEYISGNIRAYHFSFHRFGSGVSNIRKAPGFHLLASAKDPVAPNDDRLHRFTIAVTGARQRIFVDGRLIHDIVDDRKTCLNQNRWQHPLPCLGTGPVPTQGAFGIRLTQRQRATFDNLNVYRLVKNPSADRATGD